MANTSTSSTSDKTTNGTEEVDEAEIRDELSFVAAVFDTVDDAKSVAYKQLKGMQRGRAYRHP